VHEIKHDGYRLIVRRDGKVVQLFTRRGHDWTERYPGIAATARRLMRCSMRSICWSSTARIFDRCRSASARRKLARLLAGSTAGIVYNEHTDEDAATVFRHACRFGFEGIVSKRFSAPYRSGPSRDWLKIKNPDSPAMVRHRVGRW
jgi:bifunctional non-homologous end joining protein LigD